MIERSGDETGRVDLGDTVGAHAREARFGLEEGQGVGDCFVVAVLDGLAISSGANAHSADTDLTGVKVRS